ncbi:MAG: PQQ-like beta-propeller repeat protein [Proteobacteria bacterium]|nr:PQQ-like beta-propeller repeat protein [Pseudomonadota bacterium]
MMGDGSFKIVFNGHWTQGASALSSPQVLDAGKRFDPAEVRGRFDMVVDGTSLLAQPSEDSLFFLVRDLLLAAERIAAGDPVARVSFYEAPYELVLQRLGDDLSITFYRGGASPEVMVKDQRIPLINFLRGLITSTHCLIAQATEADVHAQDNALIQWMGKQQRILEDIVSCPLHLPADPPAAASVVESTRWRTPRTPDGFSLGFRFVADATDLRAKGVPAGNDLNALLFRGQFVVHAKERRRIMGEGFLFLQLEKMLFSVRKVLSAWEERRPMSVRLNSGGMTLALRLGADDQFSVTLINRKDEAHTAVLNDITPWQWSDAILGVAREVRRYVLQEAPLLRRNIRVEMLSRELRQLTEWAREQQRQAVINPEAERYRSQAIDIAPARPSNSFRGHSHLMFREKWRIEAEGLELERTLLCEDIAVISARGFMLGVDIDSSAVLWKREVERCDAVVVPTGRDGIARVAQTGLIELIDLRSGACRWQTKLLPRAGGSPVAMLVEQGTLPGTLIVAEEEKKLVALDLRTGEPRWRYAAPRGGRFSLRRHGRLLYVSSSDTLFTALDVENGALVWRFPERTMFHLPAGIWEDTLVVPGGRYGKTEGVLFGIDAYSGERRWATSLDGGSLTAPIIASGVAMMPVRKGGHTDLAAFDVQTGAPLWRVPCDGWAETCSLLAYESQFIVNVAGGVLRAIDARSGDERWMTYLGPTCSDDIPLGLAIAAKNGVLFVPADTVYVVDPHSGDVVHALSGEPPVPDLLNVDERGSLFVAEESGHIGFFELARRFAVVPGGR